MSRRLSPRELDQLSEAWTLRLEDGLDQASFTPLELSELAAQQRSLSRLTDSPGQRRAFIALAERFERAARERAAVSS